MDLTGAETDGDRPGVCDTDGCGRPAAFGRCRPCQRAWRRGKEYATDRIEARIREKLLGGVVDRA